MPTLVAHTYVIIIHLLLDGFLLKAKYTIVSFVFKFKHNLTYHLKYSHSVDQKANDMKEKLKEIYDLLPIS